MYRLLPVITATIGSLQINAQAMTAALTEDLLATDVADYLVRKGLPFRQAHHVVGAVVLLAIERQVAMSQLDLATLRGVSDFFEADVKDVFDYGRSVAQRKSFGGTSPKALHIQIELAKAKLDG